MLKLGSHKALIGGAVLIAASCTLERSGSLDDGRSSTFGAGGKALTDAGQGGTYEWPDSGVGATGGSFGVSGAGGDGGTGGSSGGSGSGGAGGALGNGGSGGALGKGGSGGMGGSGGKAGAGAAGGTGGAGASGGSAGTGGGPPCGNGNVDAGEQCDDGARTNGDGCNSQCQVDCIAGFAAGTHVFSLPNGRAHCYWLNPADLSWTAARQACVSRGMHLVTIHTAQESQFVSGLHDDRFWIGASDGLPENSSFAGSYDWVTAESFSYEMWDSGEPDHSCQSCGGSSCCEHCVTGGNDAVWRDQHCDSDTYASVCEWSAPGF